MSDTAKFRDARARRSEVRPVSPDDGPELRIFWPGTEELTRSYLPDDAIRSSVHEDAVASLEMDHPELRLDGSAKAVRIGGDGLDLGLPAAYGYLFTYRTKLRQPPPRMRRPSDVSLDEVAGGEV